VNPHCFDADADPDPDPDPAQNLDADPDPDPDPEGGGGGRSAKNVHSPGKILGTPLHPALQNMKFLTFFLLL
jgi:hypothetical protein